MAAGPDDYADGAQQFVGFRAGGDMTANVSAPGVLRGSSGSERSVKFSAGHDKPITEGPVGADVQGHAAGIDHVDVSNRVVLRSQHPGI